MTTQQIGYFLKLAEELNYTKVAQMFFITQPTLSKQIVNLENELKVTLFSRDHNSVKLTDAGKRFYERMKPIFQDLMDAIRDAQRYDDNRETLSIGIQEEQLISNSLTLAINDFRSDYPDVNISIHRANIDELLDGLNSGKFDVLNLLANLLFMPGKTDLKERYVFLETENESYYLAYAKQMMDLPEMITKVQLAEILSTHDVIFPVLRNIIDDDQAKTFFVDSLGIIDESSLRVHIVQSGRPISLPTQVASQLGVSLSNKTSLFSIDPEISLTKVEDTEGAYQKGLVTRINSDNKYAGILLTYVEKQIQKSRS